MDELTANITTKEDLNLTDINNDLDAESKEIVKNIVTTGNSDDFKNLVAVFNLNQKKKNAVRIAKLNELLEKVEDQAIERFEKRPDQMSNDELIKYLQVVQQAIDRSQNYVDKIEDRPMIQINQQNITIEGDNMDRESREKVLNAVDKLMQLGILDSLEESEGVPIIETINASEIESEEKE